MKLAELYRAFSANSEAGEIARVLLSQTHWFVVNAEFDPKTGEALPQSLSAFLAKVAQPATNVGTHRDRLWRIAEHSRASVERLFRTLNESPRREQAMLPVHAVRELDANSFIKLSNRPGRNIREKLAGKPYLQAVRRFQSVNLPENRLLKAFVTRLAELLELRFDCIGVEDDDLLPIIQSWLHSDEVQAIANWDNLPPNNTLLSHRDYRRVWDAWRLLQTLDDDIARDLSQIEERKQNMREWEQFANEWTDGDYRFADMPIRFDYEKLNIRTWVDIQKKPGKIRRSFSSLEITAPVCIDLTVLHPRYATTTATQILPVAFLWQLWQNNVEAVDIELYNSDAAYFHPDTTSIASSDLFFSKDNTSEHFDRAARSFASKLCKVFKNDTLIWLVPDALNDFELKVIRRNLNARFHDAEPLPRSVAAVIEQVDYSKIKHDGFPIVVVDSVGRKTSVTKLLARFDPILKKRVPETFGFYWDRCPPIIIASGDQDSRGPRGYELIVVDGQGRWHDATRPAIPQNIDLSELMLDPRVGEFAYCINLNKSPVVGGMRLHSLRLRAGDIPLWRNQIPELSIKVMKDGCYQRFYLVSRGTTVKPIRGKPVKIAVDEDFMLPAGRSYYSFPLFQGENAEDLGFSSRLDSSAFPLKKNAVCKLDLTFEYGADEPFKLEFTPNDKSFTSIRATWRKTEELVITDAPSPEYPVPMTWADLCRVPKQNSNETSDLLEWVQRAIAQLDRDLYIRPKPRTIGVIKDGWRTDKNGGHFTKATCTITDELVLIHENSFVRELDYTDFTEGMNISFELREREGWYSGWKVAGPGYAESACLKIFDEESVNKLVLRIRKGIYFPVIQVWCDGRSISSQLCPNGFAEVMQTEIAYLSALLSESKLPESVSNEINFLLSCMHKDAPEECVKWITGQVNNRSIRAPRTVGFALGDVSKQWQKDVLSKLVNQPNIDTLRVFAYAIWREQYFVEKFSIVELKSVLNSLTVILGKNQVRARATVEMLELLLGLLRTRNSSDIEIKMLLQPHQKITKALAKQIESLTESFARSNKSLISRVQINIQKPKGDRTPDLLYALRLYLTGDDVANAIRITSISDSDSD